VPAESVALSTTVLIERDRSEGWSFGEVPESATLFLAGAALVGIAIAVRKAA
jgi:hypothetical protein